MDGIYWILKLQQRQIFPFVLQAFLEVLLPVSLLASIFQRNFLEYFYSCFARKERRRRQQELGETKNSSDESNGCIPMM